MAIRKSFKKKLIKILLFTLIISGCTIDIPLDEIEVPPIKNNINLVINLNDVEFSNLTPKMDDVAQKEVKECHFKSMPAYQLYGGYILHCEKNCCTWRFPEPTQVCEEEWCISVYNNCGWKLNLWQCNSY